MKSCLKLQLIREARSFCIPNDVKIYDFHDGIFIFYNNQDSKVHFSNFNTLSSTTLDLANTKMKSDLNTIAISPAHNIAAFGYSCGTIQLFSLQDQKVVKVFTRPKGTSILSLIFLSDEILVCSSSDNMLTTYKVSAGRFVTSFKENFTTQLSEPAILLQPLPLYQYNNELSKPRCISPELEGVIAVRTKTHLALADLSNNFDIFFENGYDDDCIFSFSEINNTEFSLGIATSTSIEVIKYANKKSSPSFFSYPINFYPNFVTFLAPSILFVIYDDIKGYLFSFSKSNEYDEISPEIHNEQIPFKGCLVNGKSMFYLFGSENSYKISMVNFSETIAQYKEEGKFDDAIDFCKRAVEGDYRATVGLPSNNVQRNLKIEEAISSFLEEKCINDFKNNKKPEEIAKFFIKLSMNMKFHNWMIVIGLKIFKQNKHLHDYFQEIIAFDHEATFFSYTKEFVDELLNNDSNLDINSFILLLPRSVSKPQQLIQYAYKKNDIKLMANIMIQKLNNYIDSAQSYYNANDSESLCELFHSYLFPSVNDKHLSESLIKWLFGIKRDENGNISFPLLACMLSYKNPLVIDTLEKIKRILETSNKPFGLDEFVNAILIVISNNSEIDQTHKIFKFVENVIVNCNVIINNSNLKLMLSHIFTDNFSEPDNREGLLIVIINQNYPIEFKKGLLQLCDKFGFRTAKRQIQVETKMYDNLFKESICNPDDDIFNIIKRLIRTNEKDIDLIQLAIETNAKYLIEKNVAKFVPILIEYFPNLLQKMIEIITEDSTRNIYIKELLNYHEMSELNLSKNISFQFCTFLCKYFPEDVRKFLECQKENITDFRSICEDYKILDCCALIYDYTGDMKSFTFYLCSYFENKMFYFTYSQSPDITSVFVNQLQFVSKELEKIISKKSKSSPAEIEELCKKLLGCFKLSFYALQEKLHYSEELLCLKTDILKNSFKQFCLIISNLIPFHTLLEFIVHEFYELNIEYTLPSLISLINDAAYDIQTKSALAELFHQDEQNAHYKNILLHIKGALNNSMSCGMCGGIINGVNCCIRLFPCGHAFHDNQTCLPKQICPICNPDVRLDQDFERPIFAIQGNQVQKRLKRFEFIIHHKESVDLLSNERYAPFTKKDSIKISPNININSMPKVKSKNDLYADL